MYFFYLCFSVRIIWRTPSSVGTLLIEESVHFQHTFIIRSRAFTECLWSNYMDYKGMPINVYVSFTSPFRNCNLTLSNGLWCSTVFHERPQPTQDFARSRAPKTSLANNAMNLPSKTFDLSLSHHNLAFWTVAALNTTVQFWTLSWRLPYSCEVNNVVI